MFDAIEVQDGVDQEFPSNIFKIDTKLYIESELTTVKDETYPIIIQIVRVFSQGKKAKFLKRKRAVLHWEIKI